MAVSMKSVKGLVTLVTGGASGLGRGTVERLHKHGSKIVILDIPQSTGAELAKKLEKDAIFVPTDVTNDEEVKNAIEKIRKEFGRLDAIVNSAGIGYAFKLYNASKREAKFGERIKHTLDVNVYGSLNVIRHGMDLMIDNEKDEMGQRGVIINVSSIAAYDGQIGQVAYSASKGAIASVTLPLARDFADIGVRAMAIAPGLFDTPLLRSLPPKVLAFLSNLIPNPQRLGSEEEFAALVQHIIENRYLNGEVIRLDGALRMPP